MATFDEFINLETGEEHWAMFYRSTFYQLSNGAKLEVISCPAWCFNCSTIVAAEYLPSTEEFASHRKELLSVVQNRLTTNGFPLSDPAEAKEELERWDRFSNALSTRTSPPRCLDCFQTSILQLRHRPGDVIEIPNGPRLKCDGCGFADCGVEPLIVLNIEGELLPELSRWPDNEADQG